MKKKLAEEDLKYGGEGPWQYVLYFKIFKSVKEFAFLIIIIMNAYSLGINLYKNGKGWSVYCLEIHMWVKNIYFYKYDCIVYMTNPCQF